MGDVVEVVLSKDNPAGDRQQKQYFGFANVPTPDNRGLLLSWIDHNGLLAQWNCNHPEHAVREGDRILSVNGVVDDIEAMRGQLQLESIRMIVQRCGGQQAMTILPP